MSQPQILQLRHHFIKAAGKYTAVASLVENLWHDAARHYNNKSRHYHNLQHLEDVLAELSMHIDSNEWDVLVFATMYHDVIYSVTAKDNEERSAKEAVTALTRLGVTHNIIQQVELCILATKNHSPTGNLVADQFTDADMSILGRSQATYALYASNVRKEYGLYPDLLYKPGRKKVLQGFLAMERIFKTSHFYSLYEQKARGNIEWEISTL